VRTQHLRTESATFEYLTSCLSVCLWGLRCYLPVCFSSTSNLNHTPTSLSSTQYRLRTLLQHPRYQDRLQYLHGSPWNAEDLRRAGAGHAQAIFILADFFTNDIAKVSCSSLPPSLAFFFCRRHRQGKLLLLPTYLPPPPPPTIPHLLYAPPSSILRTKTVFC